MHLDKMFSLAGKNAIIIGGSKGIGKGMATGLADAGATVVLASRNQADLNAAEEDIRKETGAEAFGIVADISSLDGIQKLVDEVLSRLGHIDILINAAGVNVRKSCLEFTEEDWDLVQDVQLKYVFFACQAVAKQMVEKGIKGRIINIASVSSSIALKNMVSYCAAKGGLVQMTKALALELAPYNICVNAMAPGYVSTEMTRPIFNDPARVEELMSRIPAKRFGDPEDFAGIAVLLASDAANYITGQLLIADGGWLSS